MCNNQNCRRMKTTLLVVGRTVEQHYITAINDYIQRTKRSITFDMEVIPELKNTKSLSMEVQKEKEGELILKALQPGDVVVTQDYGLASMCLAKCARVLNQNGLEYTADNIDALMLRRYENKKRLRAGKHPKGSPKRTKEQDVRFADTLEKTLSKNY